MYLTELSDNFVKVNVTGFYIVSNERRVFVLYIIYIHCALYAIFEIVITV